MKWYKFSEKQPSPKDNEISHYLVYTQDGFMHVANFYYEMKTYPNERTQWIPKWRPIVGGTMENKRFEFEQVTYWANLPKRPQ